MGIFNSKKSRLDKFKNATKGKSKKEKRNIEKQLLKPIPLPKYEGKRPVFVSDIDKRTALIVFNSEEQKELIGKILSIKTSIKGVTYVTDISVLEWIAKQVDKGKMVVKKGKVKPSKKGKKND